MSGLYGAIGGVNREIKKLYGSVNGVNREIKELWAAKDGVNRRIFSAAVGWNYVAKDTSATTNGRCSITVGDKEIYADSTLYAGTNHDTNGEITFTFSEPIYILSVDSKTLINNYGSGDSYIHAMFGNNTLYLGNSSNPSSEVSQTNQINALIDSIKIMVLHGSYSVGDPLYMSGHTELLLHTRDYGDFYLNNSGSSDQ
jgi:hypothetical protein